MVLALAIIQHLPAKNGAPVTLIYETATDPTNPATINRQLIQPSILINNWVESRELDLQQFVSGSSGSCTPITSDLNILYSCDHELMHSWHLSITTAATVPGGIPPLPSGTGPRGGFGNNYINVSTWPSCSYQLRLYARRALTTGEIDDDTDYTLVTFCK